MSVKKAPSGSAPKGISKFREKKGMSGAYKHKSSAYAGPNHTYPIGDIDHARNALSRAHFSKNPESIKKKVYAKYPGLKERHAERKGK